MERKVILGANDPKKAPIKGGYIYLGGDADSATSYAPLPELREDTSLLGSDDGIGYREGGCPLSETQLMGERGEQIYTVGTVYTDIKLDCVRDPAYDYGLHFSGFLARDPEYYADRSTNIEVWMVRGQDGKLYVYGEITDPDIVVNDELGDFKPHYCDCLHPYVALDNTGVIYYPGIATSIVLGKGGKFDTMFPARLETVERTEKGYKFEYAITNKGNPFYEGDELGFNFYYNDTNDYVSLDNYQHSLGCLPTALMNGKYVAPDAKYFDALRFTTRSAVRGADIEIKKSALIGDPFADILGGASVGIITGKNATAQTTLAAREISARLCSYGANVCKYSEGCSVAKPDFDIEICIDNTSSSDSMALLDRLEYDEYGLLIGDDSIAVAGWRQEGIEAATDMLISAFEYVRAGGKAADLDSLYIGQTEGTVRVPKMDKVSIVSDAGEGAYQPYLLDADESDFDAYLNKLLANGYKIYTKNEMDSVKVVTLVNCDSVITLSYGRRDRSLRAVAEPISGTALPALAREEYTPVCSSLIAQLGASRVYLMCYIIKLDNGEYLVIDSGSNGCPQYLFDKMMEFSGGEDIVIANWMFTHFHIDHIGGFVGFVANDEFMKHVKIKSVTYNFPQKQVLDTAPGAGDINNIKAWPSTLKKTGATVYRARTGQKFYFGNAEIEMLFTYEDLMPFNIFGDRTNPTSNICSIKINGQRVIIMGDACGEASTLCVLRYGDWLKADYVQLSHHGHGDGGTDVEFYKAINAPYVLFPGRWNAPSPAEKWARDNAKEYFLNPEDTTVIDLPYNGEKEKVKII